MAEFLQAWPRVKQSESDTITNDPDDAGGYTVYGIASSRWPNEPIFKACKERFLRPGDHVPSDLVPMVQSYYKRQWWDKLRLDEVNNQEMATKIFDTAINIGEVPAIKMAQDTVGATATGKMDDETISLLNS